MNKSGDSVDSYPNGETPGITLKTHLSPNVQNSYLDQSQNEKQHVSKLFELIKQKQGKEP